MTADHSPRVVIDTNVIVSAALTAGGASDHLLQLVLVGDVICVVDSRILAEYDEVLARPKFGFEEQHRGALLGALRTVADHVTAPPLKLSLPDPDDRAFVEVAVAGGAMAIITGNTSHFSGVRDALGIDVLTPRQAIDSLRR